MLQVEKEKALINFSFDVSCISTFVLLLLFLYTSVTKLMLLLQELEVYATQTV